MQDIAFNNHDREAPAPRPRSHKQRKVIVWIVILVIAVVVIGYAWSIIAGGMAWHAVFLTNNQVYFGHFWAMPFASTITLRNVYYLQIAPDAQDLTGQQDQSKLKLVQLGSEIHGPTDEMIIPMNQVLFWETLRPDSAVVAAIKSLSQP